MPCSEDDDSQTGFGSEPSHGMSKAELRKTNKPIMEKKRRARINNCLNELKDLLLDGSDKDPNRHSKLEKADILELTVKHLQKLQRQQLAAAIAADPSVLHRFKAGFGDCTVEVRRYLSRLASVPTGLRHRLGNHLNSCIDGIERLHPIEYPPLVPDPLRLDGERPSAFHFVKSMKPTSPPLSPISCDSACDSSTELETPPRPVQNFPFPTPPSRSASDQDSSPDTQKPTVSSTTISPEILKQEALKNKKFMEPLSIIIDVENYKIGIDASPKRAVDYSMRHKLKRPVVDMIGPAPKVVRSEPEKTVTIPERTIPYPRTSSEKSFPYQRTSPEKFIPYQRTSPEKSISYQRAAPEKSFPYKRTSPEKFFPYQRTSPEKSIPYQRSSPENSAFKRLPEKKLSIPESIPTPTERISVSRVAVIPEPPKTVISHTAESIAHSSNIKKEAKVEVKVEAATSSNTPEQGTSTSTEMWRPW